jgi:hypothetical protein
MTAYAVPVNAEALLVAILRNAGISEAYAERIHSNLPFLLVERAGGPPRSSNNPGQAQTVDIQMSAWASSKGEAFTLFKDAEMTLIKSVRDGSNRQPQGVLTRISIPEPVYSPDEDVLVDGNPAPRYLSVAEIVVSP